MARTDRETVSLLRMILDEHDSYWEQCLPELRKYRAAYGNRFWSDADLDESMVRVETSDAYSYVESFVASLFSKAPAVEIGNDEAQPGDVDVAKSCANRFLFSTHEAFINASRLALIYPLAFLKLGPRESDNMLDRVSVKACPPWELIVDRDAAAWDEQRFCGHVYYLSVPDARLRWGDKKYVPIAKKDYFDAQTYRGRAKTQELPAEFLYIRVVELYDFTSDTLYFWSPEYGEGTKLLSKEEIPVRTYDEQPLAPIAPLYYANQPDRPLEGMSALSRVYDQCYEKNILRTYQANAVRRDSRQYLYREGAFDEEQLAKISSGVDGAMIGVDEETLAGLITEVPITPISSNFDRYANAIEQDLNRGSMTAAFTRGQATMATATEVTALAQYTASEIGKLARSRDRSIETVATIYLRIVSMMAEDGEQATIFSTGSAKVVTPKHLDSKFKISALDQGSQPIADEMKRRNLIELLPVLTQLGVEPHIIREEIVRAWDLPSSFEETQEQKAAREAAQEAAEAQIGPRSVPDGMMAPEAAPADAQAQQLATALMAGNVPEGGV